ncbi:Blue (type 1) copper domain protein [Methylophaga frappieri]|uniref:Blue (Type 1) copper domain protein n=1 Tax=Methylophaga frappieri (strain ATCC BAA-2434 / DSM 25690 / JAM7) TaxID=754477 RepID=I1YJK0_METFJ|nr:plastocyanin/azurin family copper-binding protein [Methylophaga frappieri]AFJ03093.1 Blue (type 1) copper domain protein [Methylophaga frappieri]
MRTSKAIISAIIIAAIAIFVVAAVSTFISGSSDHYDRPGVTSETDPQNAPEPIGSEQTEALAMTDDTSAIKEQEQAALEETMVEEVVDETSDIVDLATEEASEASAAIAEKTSEVIAQAEDAAATGREEAETLLEQASQAAEQVVNVKPSDAEPKTHTIAAQGLIYAPLVVQIAPGDKVTWTNMSTHDTQSIEGLIPEGAEMWHSPMSENFQRTFTEEGIYIYKCTPHFGAGMGGAIIVGQPVNLEQIQNAEVNGAAKRLVKKALQVAESM